MALKKKAQAAKAVDKMKIIYVIVPESVSVTNVHKKVSYTRRIPMEAGRLMAQAVHVGRKMENKFMCDSNYQEITTIVLSVRNSRELSKVRAGLCWHIGLENVFSFEDTNEQFYNTTLPVLTAVCTTPVLPHEAFEAIGHLDLYGYNQVCNNSGERAGEQLALR